MTDGPATMTDGSFDGALVARVLDGDREAFAEVYDRYANRLYDFAHSMLRNRDDASDAVADAFVAFAEKLPQLREPDRLRPWLYAIVRTECLRRIKGRQRFAFGGDDQLADMSDTAMASDELVARSELQQLVWDAAGGLAERDRALLDLHLRQGLDGADLGDAMGVSASNAYVMMNRLRGQLERALGALLVAKTGRSDCADLDGTLANWDGEFSPLVRKRVARHVDGCPKCTARRAAMASPLALFAGISAFAAPAGLRERVLGSVTLEPGRFSQSAGSGGSSLRRRLILGGIAVVIIASAVFLAPGRIGEGQVIRPVDAPAPGVRTSVPPPTPTASPTQSPPPQVNPQPDPSADDSADEDDSDSDDEPEEEPTDPDEPGRPPVVVDPGPAAGTVDGGSGQDPAR